MPTAPLVSPVSRVHRSTADDSAVVEVLRAGTVPYPIAYAWQHERADGIAAGTASEALLLLAHPPVITLGRRADPAHVLLPEATLRARGIALARTDRGGDVTFHGPGQLVAYPLLHLRRRGIGPATYVRALEQAVIATLAQWGIAGTRAPGRPGVWVGDAKVAAIGVRVHCGVSLHGLALNVSTDLRRFETIIPCGIADARVTSMEALLGRAPALDAVATVLAETLADVLGLVCISGASPAVVDGQHAARDVHGATDAH